MRITRIIIGFYILVCSACSTPTCQKSDQYILGIKYLNDLKSYKGSGALVGKALEANLVLSSLTEIESKVDYGDITVYSNYKNYRDDLKNWKKWLDDESCKVDIKILETKTEEVLRKSDWITK